MSVMGGASTDCAICIYSRHTPTHVAKKTQALQTMFTARTLQLMFSSPYRQNTACSRTWTYSPDDGHNYAQNMFRQNV